MRESLTRVEVRKCCGAVVPRICCVDYYMNVVAFRDGKLCFGERDGLIRNSA